MPLPPIKTQTQHEYGFKNAMALKTQIWTVGHNEQTSATEQQSSLSTGV